MGDRNRVGWSEGWVGEEAKAALKSWTGSFKAHSMYRPSLPSPNRLFVKGSQLCGQAAPGPMAAAP